MFLSKINWKIALLAFSVKWLSLSLMRVVWKYHFADHGITIMHASFQTKKSTAWMKSVCLVDPFHFPENYTPVSAVVWINAKVPVQSLGVASSLEVIFTSRMKVQCSKSGSPLVFFSTWASRYSLEVMSFRTVDPHYGIWGALSKWRKKFPQAGTWQPIIEALRILGAVRLTQQLEEQHQKPHLTHGTLVWRGPVSSTCTMY